MLRKYSWCVGVIASAFVGVVACSSSSAGSSCGNYVDALNSLASKCGAQPFFDSTQRSGFVDECSALANAPGVNNFPSQIDACTSVVNASSCSLNGINCPIKGTLADGSPCASSVQCSGGVCTVTTQGNPTSDISCGVCSSYLALGAPCGNAQGSCDPSVAACVAQKCTAYVQQGGSCAAGGECVAGTTCDTATTTCKPAPTKGEACTGSCSAPYKCISQVCSDAVAAGGPCPTGIECASSLTCDQTSKTCKAEVLASAGQACGLVNTTFVLCGSELRCDSTSSTCVALLGSGAACKPGEGDCQIGLACTNNVCATVDYTICNK